MSRYMIKFSKEGAIRYISHLDLLRLFKRSFKRVGIKLQYSQGFNPHPKMSFAQPLSLGYTSIGEYLEFETADSYPPHEILEKINSVMPEGIEVLTCSELTGNGKTLAALTEYADYEIIIPGQAPLAENWNDRIKKYMEQDQILVQKHQKKSGKEIEINIKPMISELDVMVDNNNITITSKLAAGSTANLSPEILIESFCDFVGLSYDRSEISVKRKEIYFHNSDRHF